ncbi:MAG: dTDP-glucose 4,6-dehydratase, partial [Candidatus Moranbacteria bacterium GW2011_GWF1_34_10]
AIDKIIREGKIGDTYCIGGGAEKTNLEITHKILELMEFDDTNIEYVPDRKGHDKRYAVDFSKIKSELAWEPSVSFEDGIKETVEWYKNNIQWLTNIKTGEYRNYGDHHLNNKHTKIG